MRVADLPPDRDILAALLAWQAELGAEEPVGDVPVDRYALPTAAPWLARGAVTPGAAPTVAAPPAAVPAAAATDPVEEAKTLALGAATLADLAEAQAGYDRCDLKRGARSFVFADGTPAARVMIVGEAPGNDEDRLGRPFVGAAGQLLDRMFAAIGLSRTSPDPGTALYITNILPWRPPQNRDPTPEEMAMMVPFVRRHIELAAPDILVLMGNSPCQALLGRRGITRMRGQWADLAGRPVLPMTHPAFLLRTPAAKREAWADLLSLKARLAGQA